MTNPWGLTPRQAAAMDAMVEHDMAKVVAAKMGVTPKAIEDLMRSARHKMGLGYAGIRHRHLILWDRYRTGRLGDYAQRGGEA